MLNITATDFCKNLFSLLEQIIQFNARINISTKNGNVVALSENEYNDLVETLYVVSNSAMCEKVKAGLHTLLAECVSGNEVTW